MKPYALACAALVAAIPASAAEVVPGIVLLPGHPIHHESEREAGVTMALSITPEHDPAVDLAALCDELRRAAGLSNNHGDGLRLETIFVVPYKGMAIEGYYWPGAGAAGSSELVRGDDIARVALDDILTRAGIPAHLLDETDVEQEMSCAAVGDPGWHIVWQDVQPIGHDAPSAVIERAYARFMAVHDSIVDRRPEDERLHEARIVPTAN